jgi:glycosyltransferase involved in cell wall biosynthesis
MRILIFHGYLLEGTGSNVYNARLAKALVKLGHEVHLLCQDRHPDRAGFVDLAGDWDGGALSLRPLLSDPSAPVRCTLYRPDIGGLLPVYVHDRYEGVQAQTFALCSDEQIRSYLDANVEAVREVASIAMPDLALANHLVMGPAILARGLQGKVPYAVKVHGSALEYTVKPERERFLPFAREGLAQARGVLVGSLHTAQSLWQALGESWTHEHDLRRRTRLGPPGVDVDAFAPRAPEQARAGLQALARRLGRPPSSKLAGAGGGEKPDAGELAGDADTGGPGGDAGGGEPAGDAFARDEAKAAAALARLGPDLTPTPPIVVYVGKLIVSKGVDLLLAAWPLVLQRVPDARLAIVGFGALQGSLEGLLRDLASGEMDAVRRFAAEGRALEGGPPRALTHLGAFLDELERSGAQDSQDYFKAATSMQERVAFTGRLDHEQLSELLPACGAIVVPSTFPEAFGMVAVEAAACGLLPISAAHSGLAEVSDVLARVVPQQAARWLSFPVDDGVVEAIADRVASWLQASPQTRASAREAIVAAVRARWSWEGVARGVIAAAQGAVEQLPGL